MNLLESVMLLKIALALLGEAPTLAEDVASAIAEIKASPNGEAIVKSIASNVSKILAEVGEAL